MTQEKYEAKKRECWEQFWHEVSGSIYRCPETYEVLEAASYSAFDRAYALGKQEKDTEGKEMLYAKAKTVREMYAANDRLIADYISDEIERQAVIINEMLRTLFGSKCLPDEE